MTRGDVARNMPNAASDIVAQGSIRLRDILHPDEGVQQAQAVKSAGKDATIARRAPAA